MKRVERFYYQPDFLSGLVSWSWTLMTLVVGVIFWLEVTHFNWITAAFFVAFLLIMAIQIVTRTIEVVGENLILNRTIHRTWIVMDINEIENVSKYRWGIKLFYNGIEYRFMMTPKSRNQLLDLLAGGEA